MPARKGLSTSPSVVAFQIPPALAKEFGRDLRIVVRHPWVVGIPIPERLLSREMLGKLGAKEFDVMLTPKMPMR